MAKRTILCLASQSALSENISYPNEFWISERWVVARVAWCSFPLAASTRVEFAGARVFDTAPGNSSRSLALRTAPFVSMLLPRKDCISLDALWAACM
jgi:hypothetical protein